MKQILVGGMLLTIALGASTAHAGLLVRQDEARPTSALEPLRSPRGFLPSDAKLTWNRFLDSIERIRDAIPKPALLDPRNPRGPEPGDLGDGFLEGFRKERGLHRKLKTLAGYRIGLSRIERWFGSLPAGNQQALRGSLQALHQEASTAEGILTHQIGVDLAHGGKALQATNEHVQRAGFTEDTAEAAFGGLARGLKARLVSLASSGDISEDARQTQAAQITRLERLIRGE